jgi:hypothetical protein
MAAIQVQKAAHVIDNTGMLTLKRAGLDVLRCGWIA